MDGVEHSRGTRRTSRFPARDRSCGRQKPESQVGRYVDATAFDRRGLLAEQAASDDLTDIQTTDAPRSTLLIDLVQALARQAARKAFACVAASQGAPHSRNAGDHG
jgi:hypothetical protein